MPTNLEGSYNEQISADPDGGTREGDMREGGEVTGDLEGKLLAAPWKGNARSEKTRRGKGKGARMTVRWTVESRSGGEYQPKNQLARRRIHKIFSWAKI